MQILVEVKPNSSINKIEKITDNVYKVRLTVPPKDGKANQALIKLLADYFKIAKSRITIKTGKISRTKVITISG
ncbi:MAG: DUF167 domain-containing protein [Patescibacteria group bacterium]